MTEYYIVYKTTNLIDGKIYIGIHLQRKKPPFDFDGYLGSGLLLNRAIKKHGIENFVRETIEVCESYEDARLKEKQIVNLDFLLRDDVYNISVGGTGGNTRPYETKEQKQEKNNKRIQTAIANGPIQLSEEQIEQYRIRSRKRIQEHPHSLPDNKGRIHTDQALANMREGYKKRTGKYKWITNGSIAVIHNIDDIIPDGWFLGRGDDSFRFKQHNEESKKKIANNPKIKGVICYTDGVNNLKLQNGDTPPEGYIKGMTQRHKKTTWITNGIDNRRHDPVLPIPDSWYKGITNKKRIK